MIIARYPQQQEWDALCRRPAMERAELFAKVQTIMDAVKQEGDAALYRFSKTYDGVRPESLRVSEEEIAASDKRVSESLKSDIRLAISTIRTFHAAQVRTPEKIETFPGVTCWREARPIEKVGIYIPGGTAPLFSSVLMLGIPAVLAGCSEIVLCSPPRKDGTLHPLICWAAREIGLKILCKVGGAQAVAAMAYGTESVPAVHKILGPGNQYVTAAKQLVSTEHVAIDMPAGPSEVLVIADASANPVFVAADLLSQAEHGADSQAVLLTCDPEIIRETEMELQRQIGRLPRAETAAKALEHSSMILLEDIEACLAFSNIYAPEHLILHTEAAEALTEKIMNAGSVFIGPYTPESAGDYASGTNHTLPTNGFARNYSGVSLDSYVKMLTFQQIDEKGLLKIGPSIERMAEEEELEAHKQAVRLRLEHIKERK